MYVHAVMYYIVYTFPLCVLIIVCVAAMGLSVHMYSMCNVYVQYIRDTAGSVASFCICNESLDNSRV